ncbi:hypothetical protein D3C75_396160 [compost metagenome]
MFCIWYFIISHFLQNFHLKIENTLKARRAYFSTGMAHHKIKIARFTYAGPVWSELRTHE